MTDTPAAAGTPRTDAVLADIQSRYLSSAGTRMHEFASFARTLERELAAVQLLRAAADRHVNEQYEQLSACRAELAETEAAYKFWFDTAAMNIKALEESERRLLASESECMETFNLAAEQQARAEQSERLLAERDATLHKFFDDADLFTKYSMDSGATWQRYPLERRIALAIAVCKDDTDAKERDEAERLLAAAAKDAERYHRVMGLIGDTQMAHGKCQPRADKACTACNAQDALSKMLIAYGGPPIQAALASKEPTK